MTGTRTGISSAILALCVALAPASRAFAQADSQPAAAAQAPAPVRLDPFADLAPAQPGDAVPASDRSWLQDFFSDNFGFRKEIMSEFDSNADGSGASRQSLGFEILKKFSNSTSTIAGFDFQARLVRRDGYNPVPNDMEGAGRPGWAFEYHNLYLDLYNVLNPILGDQARADNVGRFNLRIGHFYVPFGLNLQTDTHGTLLQLSNGDNFGFDEDWGAGFWGAIDRHFNYGAYYLAGSGYDLELKGHTGLAALRISLADRYSSRYGIEGGISLLGGQRLSAPMLDASGVPAPVATVPIKTQRIGLDARYRHSAPKGLLTFTTELSGGRDNWNPVVTLLHQAEYLHASRRWGLATQFRSFYQDSRGTNSPLMGPDSPFGGTNSSLIGEFTWYFRNDVGNSNSHSIRLNIERQLQSVVMPAHTIVTLQYYFYL